MPVCCRCHSRGQSFGRSRGLPPEGAGKSGLPPHCPPDCPPTNSNNIRYLIKLGGKGAILSNLSAGICIFSPTWLSKRKENGRNQQLFMGYTLLSVFPIIVWNGLKPSEIWNRFSLVNGGSEKAFSEDFERRQNIREICKITMSPRIRPWDGPRWHCSSSATHSPQLRQRKACRIR